MDPASHTPESLLCLVRSMLRTLPREVRPMAVIRPETPEAASVLRQIAMAHDGFGGSIDGCPLLSMDDPLGPVRVRLVEDGVATVAVRGSGR